jgi:hypothetical protein
VAPALTDVDEEIEGAVSVPVLDEEPEDAVPVPVLEGEPEGALVLEPGGAVVVAPTTISRYTVEASKPGCTQPIADQLWAAEG